VNTETAEPAHHDPASAMTWSEEAVYLGLCRNGAASVEELCSAEGLSRDSVLQALLGLRIRGLTRGPELTDRGAWYALAPDLALETTLNRRERSERTARDTTTRLLDVYLRERGQRDPHASGLVEVVTGQEAIAEVWDSLQAGARVSVDVLEKPPFVQSDEGASAPELEVLARGVAARGIYERSSLLSPGKLAEVQELISAGEMAAMVPSLPFKLAVVDRRRALLPVGEGTELTAALLVRPSPLLDALIEVFESQWVHAMPVPRAGRPGVRAEVQDAGHEAPGESAGEARTVSEEVLTMLSAGMTDEAIARQLGVSARTVQRRISDLMDSLGSRNRFQAGVQAVRHGLL
jgi:DNA-binding CsgD family transcriptional regulator